MRISFIAYTLALSLCCTLCTIFGRPFVKRFALCYRTVVCLSVCLSCPVCNVGVLWPNGLTDQDESWHAGRPRPWPHCVRWGSSSPSPKGHSPPIFGPYPLRPYGCMDQDATLHGARPRPRRLCVTWGPSPPPKFSAHVYYSYCDFVRTLHSAQSMLVCSSSSFSNLCILFLGKKSLIVLNLFRCAHLHHIAPIAWSRSCELVAFYIVNFVMRRKDVKCANGWLWSVK